MRIPGIDHDVTTALLDVDGTMIDSTGAHAEAWSLAFADFGYTVGPERIRPLIGMGGDRLLPRIAPELHADTEPGRSIAARRADIFTQRFLAQVRPTNGARQLLETLKTGGVQLVVATSANAGELDGLLDAADIRELIDVRTTAADAASSKPAPDVVQAALERFAARASSSVMLGDTKFDIEAAAQAGVPTIALRCGGSSDEELAGAAAIFDDPAALEAVVRA